MALMRSRRCFSDAPWLTRMAPGSSTSAAAAAFAVAVLARTQGRAPHTAHCALRVYRYTSTSSSS